MADALTHARREYQPDFAYWPRNQPIQMSQKGYGICDPEFWGIRQAAEPWRYSKIFVRLPVIAGDITLPPGATVGSLFTYGTGKPLGNGFTVDATGAETNANDEGALVRENEKFVVTHVMTEVLRPAWATVAAPNVLRYDAWLNAYATRIREVLLYNLFFQARFGDEACQLDLSYPGLWPTVGGALGDSVVRNGAGVGMANVVRLRNPFETGSKNASDQMNIQTKSTNLSVVIGADPVVPIPPEVTSVIVPITFAAIGFPISATCVPICAARPQDLAMIAQAMAADPASLETLVRMIAARRT